jgi:hypothetical protein
LCVFTVYIQIYCRAENHTSPQIQTLEVNMNMIDKVSYVKLENLCNYLKYLNKESHFQDRKKLSLAHASNS